MNESNHISTRIKYEHVWLAAGVFVGFWIGVMSVALPWGVGGPSIRVVA